MNELLQMNFGKTPPDPLNLPQGLFRLRQGRRAVALWSLGGMVIILLSSPPPRTMCLFPSKTDTSLGHTLLWPSETRDP